MVDTVSIVIAVISFVGALLSASITGWFTYTSEERKRLSEAEKLVAKYRDPLLLAAHDLQSRFFNILQLDFLRQYANPRSSAAQRQQAWNNTCFLVGQYFAWTYILRRQVQFLRFSTDRQNKNLVRVLDQIKNCFSTDRHGRESAQFMLWRGHQMAIGELMTVKDDKELLCVGYAEFKKKWTEDASFRSWFYSIEEGIAALTETKDDRAPLPDHRLRRLQHLLVDLIHTLDSKGRRGGPKSRPCRAAPNCPCSHCGRTQAKVRELQA